MSDALYDCAKSFNESIRYNYIFDVARNNKKIVINLSCLEEEFTHVVGLDHLKDIAMFSSHNAKIKSSAFQRILSHEISFSDISRSKFFNQKIPGTYNLYTQSEYTIGERIMSLQNIEKILDESYKGKLYKWSNVRARIQMPDGRIRHTNISGDYMLAIPSKEKSNETIYLFMYKNKTGKENKNTPFQLHLFSAFTDCVDLSRGQESPFKILEERKENAQTGIVETLYTSPSYQKDDVGLSELNKPQSKNIMQVKFDSPLTSHNARIRIDGDTAKLEKDKVVSPNPNGFKEILKKIKNRLSEIFKPKDKTSPQIMTAQTVDMPNVSDEIVAEAGIKNYTKPVSKEFAALIEAREAFAGRSISQEEYRQAVENFMDTLHGKEMWIEAADTLRKQLDNCPEEMKKYIGYELKNLEMNIDKKFAPKRQQTFDELSKAANENYVKQQKEKEAVGAVSSRSDKNRNER